MTASLTKVLRMKRSDAIAANATELRRLIRSGVLGGAVLILLVSLPDFLPPLAHLLRPSRTCIPGLECFGEAIKAVVWQLRWPCAALAAVTILLGGWLAFTTRSWREIRSTKPGSLTAREIAEALPADEWQTVASATVYPHAQRRLAVTVSMNTSPEVFRYIEDEDYSARSKFAEELLEIIGEDLSANDEMALIRTLGKRLTAWQARRGCADDPVRHCLEELLNQHRQTTLK